MKLWMSFAMLSLVACAPPQPAPVDPPENLSGAEQIVFFQQICTQRGFPEISVEAAIAQGDPRKAFQNSDCVDRLVLDYIGRTQGRI